MEDSPVPVNVPGGALAVELTAGETEPVLCIHGISSQRRLFDWLRAAAPELSLVVPDLRGRGDSFGVGGPFGMARHAADMVAVLDALGLDAVHACGMSMGGFVAVELATAYPDRVRTVTLVDGGFPMPSPPGLTRENVAQAFADRVARLAAPWGSVADYAALFTSTTAPLLDADDPMVLHYLAHDLGADGRVRLRGDALADDAADVYFSELPWRQVKQPTRLVYAEWAVGPDTPPAYTPATVAGFAAELPSFVDAARVDGVDHACSIMSDRSAGVVAELVRRAHQRRPLRRPQ
jgi:pimeloyl-ACP methyl ester carboxylesterase